MRVPSSAISLIPSAAGGVHDYAHVLNEKLGTHIVQLSADTPTQSLSGELLVLHFSGYEFHPRGVPRWLVERIRTLRSRFAVLGIFFHELYAVGPPWRSAFWLSATQRRIARELANMADVWITNREGSGQWLRRHGASRPHRVMPVCSNVGELASCHDDRERDLVVFGTSPVRAAAYRALGHAIFRVARARGLQLHDIGPPTADRALAKRLNDEGVIVHGELPRAEVSRRMAKAMYGAVVYKPSFVAKSGVFAAYCAHGMCPVLIANRYDEHDGLTANRQYARGFDAIAQRSHDPAAIGQAALDWYAPHSAARHVESFLELLVRAASPFSAGNARHAI